MEITKGDKMIIFIIMLIILIPLLVGAVTFQDPIKDIIKYWYNWLQSMTADIIISRNDAHG